MVESIGGLFWLVKGYFDNRLNTLPLSIHFLPD
jgi:hypothetical protein